MEEYFEIGQIVNTNGLKGFLKIKPYTDDINIFKKIKKIYIAKTNSLEEFNIEDAKFIGNMVIIKLQGIDDINQAESYRNSYVKIKRQDEEPLEEGTYYIIDLIGCEVITDEGIILGNITEVFPTGSNDVYVVKNEEGKQVLIPAIKEVVKDIDIKSKKVIVKLIEGLL